MTHREAVDRFVAEMRGKGIGPWTAAPPLPVRLATVDDIPILARHRCGMFVDMGLLPAASTAAVEAGTVDFLERALPAGTFVGFVVEDGGAVVAGGGLLLRAMMPNPEHPAGFTEAYVLNVFTEESHRRRGLARHLMEAIATWCRENAVGRISLHASGKGLPLYLSMGFEVKQELRLEPGTATDGA